MAARLFQNHRLPKPNSKAKSATSVLSAVVSPLGAMDELSQSEYHALLHHTILSNLPYYSALARYRHLRRRASEGRLPDQGKVWRKNLRMYFRMTESGLCLLKTGYAKKPKSPV